MNETAFPLAAAAFYVGLAVAYSLWAERLPTLGRSPVIASLLAVVCNVVALAWLAQVVRP